MSAADVRILGACIFILSAAPYVDVPTWAKAIVQGLVGVAAWYRGVHDPQPKGKTDELP